MRIFNRFLIDASSRCIKKERERRSRPTRTLITLTDDFKPKRLSAYRVPERLKPEVDQQI